MRLWAALVLAAITVTFFRFSTESAVGPQILTAQAPFERPLLVSPAHFLAGSGEDDESVISRSGDVGKDWSTTMPESGEPSGGFEQAVSSCEMGATQAFMAMGANDANSGMFGVQREKTAQPNAQVGCRSLERENALRRALAWIGRQQQQSGLWPATGGQDSTRLSALALACLIRSHEAMESSPLRAIDHAMAALAASEMEREPRREDRAFMLWAMHLEQARWKRGSHDRRQAAAARLLDQQNPQGGWRTSQQREGLIDVRVTAWSLFALSPDVDAAEVDPIPGTMRAPAWLAGLQPGERSAATPFPMVWDSITGKAVGTQTDQLWGTFAVLMADSPGLRGWCGDLVREIAHIPCDERLFADPERLLVHTLIRVRARTAGWQDWLRRIEARLGEGQQRGGNEAGSWAPPGSADRLEFTLWNTLALLEVYAF